MSLRQGCNWLVPRLALLATLVLFPRADAVPPQEISLLGFTADSARAHREAESRFTAELARDRISDFHRLLTRQPHIAGTPEADAMAKQIAGKLLSFGLDTKIRTYYAQLSHPKRIRLSLLIPSKTKLPVEERSDPRDPDTSHPRLAPSFIAYSASGRVRGPLVYVNYGRPVDYEALAAAGVEVRGRIVLARYGKVHRAVKVYEAEQRGARGVLIYSDPADDGYAQGDPWPKGPWRQSWFVQRGNAKYSWFWHGDPLTPHVAATREAARLKPEEARTLPKIPAVAISWASAQQIFLQLKGSVVPRGFQGALPFTYHMGPGPAEVELDVEMDSGLRPILNVVARLEGREEPDRWVIVGTHHDAWTFGGVDPGSSAAVVLELARALSELRKTGWQPRRTIVFAFWDAEEYGLIGSTEYAEELAEELREKAVAYINSDLYLAGRLEAGGTSSLRDFVIEVARAVAHPAGKGSVYTAWRDDAWRKLSPVEKQQRAESFEVELEPLGSGADFVPFQTYLGLPTLSLEFGIEGSYGSYHSSFDTRYYMEKFGDPRWHYGRALAELLGRAVMRLASAEVLPLRFTHTAEGLQQSIQRLEEANLDLEGKPYLGELGLDELYAHIASLGEQARQTERALARALAEGTPAQDVLRPVNDHLAGAEKSFVEEATGETQGVAPWYRHTVYGWDIYALYSGQTLPGMHRALRAGDAAAFAAERARGVQAVKRAREELAQATALLAGAER